MPRPHGPPECSDSLWQEVAEACHHCHCWLHLNGRIVTAMTTLLVLLAVIAGVAIIAALRDVLFHDGSHSFRQPPASNATVPGSGTGVMTAGGRPTIEMLSTAMPE